MNHRNKHNQNNVESIEFKTFRTKKTQTIVQPNENSFIISRNTNSLTLGLLITYFLKKSLQTLKHPPFNLLNIQQVPRQFSPYQHQHTLHSLLNIIANKVVTVEVVAEIINQYPIVEFVMNCYVRCLVMEQIQNIKSGKTKNIKSLQLMGNEEEILSDYTIEIRGNLLDIAAECLQINMKVTYGKDQAITQQYGNANSINKLQVLFNQEDKFKFTISTSNINSSLKPYRERSRQSHSRNSAHSPALYKNISDDCKQNLESRSANKQVVQTTCNRCQKKTILCMCNSHHINHIKVPQSKVTLNSTFSSISQFTGLETNDAKQLNQRKCKCNRSYCRYCKEE